jgi:nucleotide-binding universal stress UspA family protein
MQRSIVCAVDGSPAAEAAAEVAAGLAVALNRRLVLAHVAADPHDFPFPYKDVGLRASGRRRVIDRAHRLLDRVARVLRDVAAERRVVIGAPVEQLLRTCREEVAELLVVGSSRRQLSHAAPRSIATRLAQQAPCPVVVVGGGRAAARFLADDSEGGCIACAFDGSPESKRALRAAADLAARLGLELRTSSRGIATSLAPDESDIESERRGLTAELRELASQPDVRLIVADSVRVARLPSASDLSVVLAAPPVLVVPPASRAPHSATIGRFSTGIERLPDTRAERRVGRYSTGLDQRRGAGERPTGRFSTGLETTAQTPSKLRVGSFATGSTTDD